MRLGIRFLSLLAAGLVTLAGYRLLLAGTDGSPSRAVDLAVAPPGPGGATDLALAPGLSFADDRSDAFPIRGKNLGDGKIASDRPTAIFFGASHCWNTNREAERFVALYRKDRGDARFLVVDLHDPSADQRKLVARFYRGFIPTLAFLDRDGNVVYDRAGETARERRDVSELEKILERARSASR